MNDQKNEPEIWLKARKLSDIKPGESWAILYYGPSGSGKTYFCGTAGSRALFINIGKGIETLLSPAFTKRYGDLSKDMIIAEANTLTDVMGAITYYSNKCPDDFDTVIVDDATFLRRAALDQGMLMNTNSAGTARGRERGNELNLGNFVIPEPGDYFREMQLISHFIAETIEGLKAEKKHFILTAHERHIYGKPAKIGDEAPLQKIMPAFTGKSYPDDVPGYFDDVFRAEAVGGIGNQVYRCWTAGNDTSRGKARHGGIFDTVVIDPNFRVMLKKIRDSAIKTEK
jgi:hypothetical protein